MALLNWMNSSSKFSTGIFQILIIQSARLSVDQLFGRISVLEEHLLKWLLLFIY